MDLELTSRRALVTGASAGLGAATATALAAEGVRLALMSRRGAPMRALVEQFGATTILCDITDPNALDRGADAAVAAVGGIDILINAAGASGRPSSARRTWSGIAAWR